MALWIASTFNVSAHCRDLLRNGLAAMSLMSAILSCSSGKFANAGRSEKEGATQHSKDSEAVEVQNKKAIPVAKAIYAMKIKGKTGIELCNGVVEMIVDSGFNLNPHGSLRCLSMGNLDLKDFFGGDPVIEKDEDMKIYPGFGKIIRSQNPVTLSKEKPIFTPPRPAMIGPVIQDPTSYANFSFSESSQVQGVSKITGASYSAAGQWFVQVLETNSTYVPEAFRGTQKFNSVVKWQLRATGFESAPRASIKAFTTQTYWFNTDPIAIPRIEIDSSLSELMPQSTSSTIKLGDKFFSGVYVILDLVDYIPL